MQSMSNNIKIFNNCCNLHKAKLSINRPIR